MKRAIELEGFTIIMDRELPYRPATEVETEIRIVRADRNGIEAHRDAVFSQCWPHSLVTNLQIRGIQAQEADPACFQVEIGITHNIPFPAAFPFEAAVECMVGVRDYLLESIQETPPPGWSFSGENPADIENIFHGHCCTHLSGTDGPGVEILIEHIWVFEESEPSNEAELEGESEAILGLIAHIWQLLLPPGHEQDPLAPLSFLVSYESDK